MWRGLNLFRKVGSGIEIRGGGRPRREKRFKTADILLLPKILLQRGSILATFSLNGVHESRTRSIPCHVRPNNHAVESYKKRGFRREGCCGYSLYHSPGTFRLSHPKAYWHFKVAKSIGHFYGYPGISSALWIITGLRAAVA